MQQFEHLEPAERSCSGGRGDCPAVATCTTDHSAKGARDAAILTVFYGCGLRRGELARLDLRDFDREDGSLLVQGKRNKQRTVYLPAGGGQHIEAWLRHRGDEPGPLFCPVRQTGEIPLIKMRGEAIAYILRRRQGRGRPLLAA